MTEGLPRKAGVIFDVALRQLAHGGYDALTVEGIAAEAGVNKTTIYRWWSGKDEVLSAAVRAADLLRIDVPNTGSLREDVIDVLEQIGALLESAHVRSIVAGILDGGRPGLAHLATEFVDDRLIGHRQILDRAVARGEIGSTFGVDAVFHPLIGALWIRVLLLRDPVDRGYLESVTDAHLEGVAPTRAPTARTAPQAADPRGVHRDVEWRE